MTTPKITFMTQLLNISKYIGAVSGIVAVMWGGFKFIDNVASQTRVIHGVQDQLTTIQDSIEVLSNRMDDINLQVEGINENTMLIGNHVEEVNMYVKGVNKAFNYHIETSPAVSKKDWAKMMELIDLSLVTNKSIVQQMDLLPEQQELYDPSIVVRKINK
jgi:hypothetical protein